MYPNFQPTKYPSFGLLEELLPLVQAGTSVLSSYWTYDIAKTKAENTTIPTYYPPAGVTYPTALTATSGLGGMSTTTLLMIGGVALVAVMAMRK